MYNIVLPTGVTIGSLGMLAVIGFIVMKAIQGNLTFKMAWNYLGSGLVVFFYFGALMPWVTWIVFVWMKQPGGEEGLSNGFYNALMWGSKGLGVLEHLFALAMLIRAAIKGSLTVKYTFTVLAVAVLIMVVLTVGMPWLLNIMDAVPAPPKN